MIQQSDDSRSLYFSRITLRCGDPASSSPSKKNLRLNVRFNPEAVVAAYALRIAITPPLSSDDPRAYTRNSESYAIRSNGLMMCFPLFCSEAVNNVGENGLSC